MTTEFKMVPVEPTEVMQEAVRDAWESEGAISAKQMYEAMIAAAPASPQAAQPVMKLEAEKLWGGAGEYAVSFVKAGWLDECRRTGGTFMLYTHADAGEVERHNPPQPIYDEAKEKEAHMEWFQKSEEFVNEYDQSLYGWLACAQSRAKAGEVGHE